MQQLHSEMGLSRLDQLDPPFHFWKNFLDPGIHLEYTHAHLNTFTSSCGYHPSSHGTASIQGSLDLLLFLSASLEDSRDIHGLVQ